MIEKSYSFEKDGKQNDVYTLRNGKGAELDILTYGARIIRLSLPDRKGKFSDVVVGYRKPEYYYKENPYFGATIGRVANRIGGGSFQLNGVRYELEKNEGNNTLHGGISGDYSRKIWSAEIKGDRLVLSLLSPDGEGGFPGTMQIFVSFTLTDENEVVIEYQAKSDKDTPCNLTNHTYFNIGYQPTVLDQELKINAEKITPVDDELIPHGEYMDIKDTPFSFLHAKKLGEDMFSDAPMIKRCGGFDANYCLDRIGKGVEHVAYVYDRESGRRMDCYTTLPGLQLYTACSTGGIRGKKNYVNHCALCLETQGYPNALNCPEYPSVILKAGETYHEITVYRFSVR